MKYNLKRTFIRKICVTDCNTQQQARTYLSVLLSVHYLHYNPVLAVLHICQYICINMCYTYYIFLYMYVHIPVYLAASICTCVCLTSHKSRAFVCKFVFLILCICMLATTCVSLYVYINTHNHLYTEQYVCLPLHIYSF